MGIAPQYRAYKPTTLREKLNEYNENQQWRFDNYNKKKSILDYTLDKYSKLYPCGEYDAVEYVMVDQREKYNRICVLCSRRCCRVFTD